MNENSASIVFNPVTGHTPIIFIQDPNDTLANSFIVQQNNQQLEKRKSDNLKSFYEKSGNLEDGLFFSNVENNKPASLLKRNDVQFARNVKLSSFVVPSNENNKQCSTPLSTVILKPAGKEVNMVKLNAVPKKTVLKKLIKIQNVELTALQSQQPKKKPNKSSATSAKPKLASVQLLKLGETYHSINELNNQQMKIVNQALKHITQTESVPLEPKYDPVTNTRIVYKVVSPKDLKVVGKNRIVIKERKKDSRKSEQRCLIDPDEEESAQEPVEDTFTRSGRKVKIPKQCLPEETRQTKKKNSNISCFECSLEFNNIFRLQKHYESQPSHMPADLHSNLFQCLLSIIKTGPVDERANIFIQQLEHLIEKIKSLLPCLLKKLDGNEGELCTINDDLGRVLGMNSGKYNLNMEALHCIQDKDGHCKHNPPKTNKEVKSPKTVKDFSKLCPSKQQNYSDESSNIEIEEENTDCARIKSVYKWPSVAKRMLKLKSNIKAKKVRLASNSPETYIELDNEDYRNNCDEIMNNPSTTCAINVQSETDIVEDKDDNLNSANSLQTGAQPSDFHSVIENRTTKSKGTHKQFHSAHFDIRSSPIKSSSVVFHKFQINPLKMTDYDSPNIQPITLDSNDNKPTEGIAMQALDNNDLDLQRIFKDITQCKDVNTLKQDLNFTGSKDWNNSNSSDKQVEENYTKSDNLFETDLLTAKDLGIERSTDSENLIDNDIPLPLNDQITNHGQSVLNFLDTLATDCLNFPEAEIRNAAVDFNLDLFSFPNT